MGMGGVAALGCWIGQGVSGLSLLSVRLPSSAARASAPVTTVVVNPSPSRLRATSSTPRCTLWAQLKLITCLRRGRRGEGAARSSGSASLASAMASRERG